MRAALSLARRCATRAASVRGFFGKSSNGAARLGRCTKGSVAVEFCIIGFISLELLIETMQAGLYFYTYAGLERTMLKATRAILTGSVSSQSLTAAQYMSNVLCPAITSTHLSCSNIISNVQTVSEATSPGGFYTLLNSSQTALVTPPLDNTKTNYCPGTSQSYVFVQVLYAMPVFSPIWRTFATSFNGTPSYILQSASAFRNEPFAPGSQSC